MGPESVTVLWLGEKWLEGKEPVEIARLIRPSVASVEDYLEKFKRTAWLYKEKRFTSYEIALTVGMSVVCKRLYLGLCAEYADSPQLEGCLADIQAVGQAFDMAQDEKNACIARRAQVPHGGAHE